MADAYPPAGFHFSVRFDGFTDAADARFQSVAGLSTSIQTEEVREGGENRFSHQLPTGMTHEPLELKRGLVTDSGLVRWCRDAIEQFSFRPVNLVVTLLNAEHQPIAAWQVVNAYPLRWSCAELDAMQSTVLIETLQMQYNYFRRLDT